MVITLTASGVVAAGVLGFAATGASASTSASRPVAAASASADSSSGAEGSAGSDAACTEAAAWALLTGPNGWFAICGGTGLFAVPAKYKPFTELTIRVTNRVWLHQTYPAKGWADCFSIGNPPKTFALSGRDQNPGDLQVSANGAAC